MVEIHHCLRHRGRRSAGRNQSMRPSHYQQAEMIYSMSWSTELHHLQKKAHNKTPSKYRHASTSPNVNQTRINVVLDYTG